MSFKEISSSSPGSHPQAVPRVACRVARRWHAIAGGDSRHIASCASCQEYFLSVEELDRGLRRDAQQRVRGTGTESGTLERDIMRAVREAAGRPASERSSGSRVGWFAGAIAAVAAVAVAVGVVTRENAAVDARLSQEGAKLVLTTVGSLSGDFVDKAIPSAGELVARNPMQQEIGSVYADVQSALNFLAMNFLPSSSGAIQPARSNG